MFLNRENYGKTIYLDTSKTVNEEVRGGLVVVSVGLVAVVLVSIVAGYFVFNFVLSLLMG